MSAPVPAACVRSCIVWSCAFASWACACSSATWNGAGSILNRMSPRFTFAPLRTYTCWIGPVTCALTETISCFTCASSVDTLPPLVSQ